MTGLVSEEQRLDRKTQQLREHLARAERRAEELKRETERLRRIKDEAKLLVIKKHPGLFQQQQQEDDCESLLLSEGNGPFLSQDLQEIRDMLGGNRRRSSAATSSKFDSHLRNVRREAGVGSSRHSGSGGSIHPEQQQQQQGQFLMWPRDCVPVPVETFKRMLAEVSQRGSSMQGSAPARSNPDIFGELPPDRPDTVKSNGDDTSNDAADLSQELEDTKHRQQQQHQPTVMVAAKRKRHKEKSQNGTNVRQQEAKAVEKPPQLINMREQEATVVDVIVPKRVQSAGQGGNPAAKQSSDQLTKTVLTKPISRDSSSSSSSAAASSSSFKASSPGQQQQQQPPISPREPDENFVLPSDDNDEKLYSSESESDDKANNEEAEKKAPKSPPSSSVASSYKMVNKPYRPSDNFKNEPKEETSHTSSSSMMPADKTKSVKGEAAAAVAAAKNPLAKYMKTIKLESESDSQAKKVDEEGGLSGPEEDLNDDDFWN